MSNAGSHGFLQRLLAQLCSNWLLECCHVFDIRTGQYTLSISHFPKLKRFFITYVQIYSWISGWKSGCRDHCKCGAIAYWQLKATGTSHWQCCYVYWRCAGRFADKEAVHQGGGSLRLPREVFASYFCRAK